MDCAPRNDDVYCNKRFFPSINLIVFFCYIRRGHVQKCAEVHTPFRLHMPHVISILSGAIPEEI